MEKVLGLLAEMNDSKINTMITFLNEYAKAREIEKRMELCCKRWKHQGLSEKQIESNKICKLRVMGIIDMGEAMRRLVELDKDE